MSDRLPKKDRTQLPRQEMPTRPADERRSTMDEVNLGLPVFSAHQEALRCLECSHPDCVEGCPVGVKIREFVALIVAGDLAGAAAKLREDNVLPAITSRVCPQERQCEGNCVLGNRTAPLGIGYLERFVADYEHELGLAPTAPDIAPSGKKVAIVGSGPAGLSCAGDLVRLGHAVTVFEALHEPGGVLIYGIPEFRLPKEIVRREIANLQRMGIVFETNIVVGRTVTIDELLGAEGFSAVFIATGAGLPKFLEIPGEHLVGVYSANEFLTRVNLMHADQFPEYDEPIYRCRDRVVAVIGGGNTAVDAARTAVRLGARRTLLIYRRTRDEMPARHEEIRHAGEEGVEFVMLTSPLEMCADAAGRLSSLRCARMRLTQPGRDGRRSVEPIPGDEFSIAADLAIVALGTRANPLIQSTTADLATDPRGYLVADPTTWATSKPGVFAGGDIVTGSATVILAMGAGRQAARAIHAFLQKIG